MSVLVKETGAVVAGANAYFSEADGTAFAADHLYATAWGPAGADNQRRAAIFATRLVDQHWRWKGYKVSESQALELPRHGLRHRGGWYVYPATTIPPDVPYGTWLMALALLAEDRTADQAVGLTSLKVDVIQLNFDKFDRSGVLPETVRAALAPYGEPAVTFSAAWGPMKLERG